MPSRVSSEGATAASTSRTNARNPSNHEAASAFAPMPRGAFCVAALVMQARYGAVNQAVHSCFSSPDAARQRSSNASCAWKIRRFDTTARFFARALHTFNLTFLRPTRNESLSQGGIAGARAKF
jgi:hypothetical protein